MGVCGTQRIAYRRNCPVGGCHRPHGSAADRRLAHRCAPRSGTRTGTGRCDGSWRGAGHRRLAILRESLGVCRAVDFLDQTVAGDHWWPRRHGNPRQIRALVRCPRQYQPTGCRRGLHGLLVICTGLGSIDRVLPIKRQGAAITTICAINPLASAVSPKSAAGRMGATAAPNSPIARGRLTQGRPSSPNKLISNLILV